MNLLVGELYQMQYYLKTTCFLNWNNYNLIPQDSGAKVSVLDGEWGVFVPLRLVSADGEFRCKQTKKISNHVHGYLFHFPALVRRKFPTTVIGGMNADRKTRAAGGESYLSLHGRTKRSTNPRWSCNCTAPLHTSLK